MKTFTMKSILALILTVFAAVVNAQTSPPIELVGPLDGSILQYRFNANDSRANGADTLTVAYRIPVVGWAGIAFSRDAFMPNSEAIIGIPDDGSVLKYNLNARSAQGIVAMPPQKQTLIDYSISVDEASQTTTLVFTKIMEEPDEIPIVVGFNTMLGAWAPSTSFPVIHSRRAAFDIDLRTAEIFDAGSQVAPPPTLAPTPPANNGGGGGGGDAVVDADGFTQVEMNGQLANSEFAFKITENDPAANGQDTITVTYTVFTQGWIAVGFSDNGGLMIGSEAVIALPDENQVLKYQLTAKNVPGVVPFPDAQQTLINTSVSQDGDSTTMTFTKIMNEPGEIPLVLEGSNDFLAAWGSQNALSLHSNRESFALDLASGGVEILDTRKKSLWKAHGLLAGIAWGILSPMAIGASVIRQLFPGAMWFKIHRTLNMLVILCTIAAFTIAVVAINQETPEGAERSHFSPDPNPHKLIGLVIFIVAIVQALLGIFRPHNPDLSKGEVKTTLRKAWEVAHKVLGYSCLALAIYQVQSGIKIYNNIFQEADNAIVVYWAIIAGIGGFVVFGFIGIKVTGYKNPADAAPANKGVDNDNNNNMAPQQTKESSLASSTEKNDALPPPYVGGDNNEGLVDVQV